MGDLGRECEGGWKVVAGLINRVRARLLHYVTVMSYVRPCSDRFVFVPCWWTRALRLTKWLTRCWLRVAVDATRIDHLCPGVGAVRSR